MCCCTHDMCMVNQQEMSHSVLSVWHHRADVHVDMHIDVSSVRCGDMPKGVKHIQARLTVQWTPHPVLAMFQL